MANSQRMLTEINESGVIVKVSILVEGDTVKYLMTFEIISNKWKSKTRVTSCELRIRIYELRVQIHELPVQIDELRVQIHELLVQIH